MYVEILSPLYTHNELKEANQISLQAVCLFVCVCLCCVSSLSGFQTVD
jgi:hypothetical protein